MKNPWLYVAVVEFIMLVIIVLKKNKGEVVKPELKEEDEGHKGIIRELEFGIRGLMGCGGGASIFEIHEEGGKIFYAGVFGHDHNLLNEATIEFWPTSEIILRKDMLKNEQDEEGFSYNTMEKIKYYQLKKYRIVSEIPVKQ